MKPNDDLARAQRFGFEFKPTKLAPLLQELGVSFDPLRQLSDESFSVIVPISDLQPSALSFVQEGQSRLLEFLENAVGGVALVERGWGEAHRRVLERLAAAIVLVDRPRLLVARILRHLRLEDEVRFYGIHPTAIVDPKASLHPSVSIGPFAIVGACDIGEESRICAYTLVDHRVQIGKRVLIREHCTLGGHSLGFVRDERAAWVRIPHVGSTVVEDDVELFPYANVDRGTLVETRVCRGAKIGFYVLVGHNASVDADAMVTANVVLCGGSRVGARSWIGVGSVVKESVRIGEDVTVGLGSVVIRDVPDGAVVAGVPARPLRGKT